MEKPYKGRAIIQDNIVNVQITIPAKKHWFIIIFLGAWLGGWVFGELFALGAVTGLFGGFSRNPAGFFILFWLIGWTVGGFFAMRVFIWMLKGKEVITVGQGILKIDKKGALLSRPKEYSLDEVKLIRVQDEGGSYSGFGRRYGTLTAFNLGGMIRFDYGLQTVKFAGDLDEAEARYIIQQLKDRRLLTERNL